MKDNSKGPNGAATIQYLTSVVDMGNKTTHRNKYTHMHTYNCVQVQLGKSE